MSKYRSIYTGAEIDAAVLAALTAGAAAEGLKICDTIADAQALTVVQMTVAKVVLVLGQDEPYDGGAGIYHFHVTGTLLDNGASVLRPSNYSTGGNLRKLF